MPTDADSEAAATGPLGSGLVTDERRDLGPFLRRAVV